MADRVESWKKRKLPNKLERVAKAMATEQVQHLDFDDDNEVDATTESLNMKSDSLTVDDRHQIKMRAWEHVAIIAASKGRPARGKKRK